MVNTLDYKTQAEVFAHGGLIFGFGLPAETGDLTAFEIARIQIEEHDNSERIGDKILFAFGVLPDQDVELRARQLRSLFEVMIDNGTKPVVILTDAHNLDENSVYNLKRWREFPRGFKPFLPIFVLLGNESQIANLIAAEPSVQMRTLKMETPCLRVVDW
jgi:hypothetical protein